MKKTTVVIVLLVLGGIAISTFVALRLNHGLDYYRVATTSNMPTLRVGSLFFASNLKNIAYGSFVGYRSPKYNEIWIHRVIGEPGDIIKIKDALVYRNGQQLSEPYTWNEYVLSSAQFSTVSDYISKNNNQYEALPDWGYAVCFTNDEVKKYHLNCKKRWIPFLSQDTTMIAIFRNKGYTVDDFGPVKVPTDSYFLMGDDRHNALDSRYLGFIKRDAIVGTQIWN